VTHIPHRNGEATTTLADISKIGDIIGWKPSIDVIDWINEQQNSKG
jgi:hypothetical protein